MAETDRPRRWRWVLGLSLALNLVFVGLFAGAAWRFGAGPGGVPRGVPEMRSHGMLYVHALPKSARRAMARDLHRDGGAGVPSRAARRALYQEALTALQATPFDPAALQQVLEVQGSAAQHLLSRAQRAWLMQIEAMTPAERQAYVQRLEEVLNRGPRRKWR